MKKLTKLNAGCHQFFLGTLYVADVDSKDSWTRIRHGFGKNATIWKGRFAGIISNRSSADRPESVDTRFNVGRSMSNTSRHGTSQVAVYSWRTELLASSTKRSSTDASDVTVPRCHSYENNDLRRAYRTGSSSRESSGVEVLKTAWRLPPQPATTTPTVDTARSSVARELPMMKENWRLKAPILKTAGVEFSVRHAPNIRQIIRELASRATSGHVLSAHSRRLKRQTSSSNVVTGEDDRRRAKPQDAEEASKELKEMSMNMSNAPDDDVTSREHSRAGEKS